jgi:hypothetical protein
MRVFAKDVTGQKLVHGFESRPLRWLTKKERVRPAPPGLSRAASGTTSIAAASIPVDRGGLTISG